MSLHNEIARQLEIVKNDGAFVATAVIARHQGAEVRIELLAVDSIGCAFDSLEFRSPSLEDQTTEQLRQLADRLANRINYLLEPLCAVESDNEQRVVQMRSAPPHEAESGRCYYELIARPGAIHVCRYHKARGTARVRTPAHVTQEVLLRLVDDLAAS